MTIIKTMRANDLRSLVFQPLSAVKARLSAYIRQLVPGQRRLVITNKGRPAAVLLAYQDYLSLLGNEAEPTRIVLPALSLKQWRQDRRKREEVLAAVSNLFDIKSLSRKGQKRYKRNRVRAFSG